MFETNFPKRRAGEGDTITCVVEGMTATAQLYGHYDAGSPDENSEGFWPSLDPKAAGYIGDGKTEADLADEQAKAEAVMRSWKRGKLFYVGVAVQIEKAGIKLTDEFDHALWGVDCNYPGGDNAYLREVANELLPEALAEARAKIAALCTSLPVPHTSA